MKLLKKKEDSEWEKDVVLLILQGIPIFGILILVILGALNYQKDILNFGNRSQSDSDKGKDSKQRLTHILHYNVCTLHTASIWWLRWRF